LYKIKAYKTIGNIPTSKDLLSVLPLSNPFAIKKDTAYGVGQ